MKKSCEKNSSMLQLFETNLETKKENLSLLEFDLEYKEVVGVDEAGRGPLAGSVVASAVCLKSYVEELEEINDSKKLSAKKREKLYDIIMENFYVGVGIVENDEIDKINILNATFLAMRRAIEELSKKCEIKYVLVDGNFKIRGYEKPQEAVIKGDAKSLVIAAASIVAKVTRDRMMIEEDKKYPQYDFAKHKGYGTKSHREAILKYGACPIHRKSFLTKILKED